MATDTDDDTDDEQTTEEVLAGYDREIARIRRTVAPAARPGWDRARSADRAELEEELRAMDEEDDDDDEDIDDDDLPAAFSSPPVTFCGAGGCPTPGDPDDLVVRKGLIFRVGQYGDVGFAMSKAELSRARQLFKPVPIRLEHKDTVLDGKLGQLRSVELSADGSELHGEAALPRWLANLLPAGAPLKVSASWDRASKLLRELSLVLSPRIEGAALAAFSHTTPRKRTTMYESDKAFAKRVFAEHLGSKNRIVRTPTPSRSTPAEFAGETDEDFARRIVGTHNARNRIATGDATFSATATMPSPTAPPAFAPQVIQAPAPPTAEEDAEFARRLRPLAASAAESIRSTVAGIEAHLARLPHAPGGGVWTLGMRLHVERIATLGALLTALESGEAYRAPSPADVLALQGETVTRLALGSGKHTLEDLATALFGRLNLARSKASEAAELGDGLIRAFAIHGDVEGLRVPFVAREREASAWRLERDAMEATAAGLGPALGAAVSRAVEAAGGEAQVARDLADATLIAQAPATPDPDEEELAAVDGQLKALGTSATGRAAQVLQSRRAELAESVERRRGEARARVEAEAVSIVSWALSGRVSAWRKLADAAKARPAAFAESLGRDLEAAPLAAIAEAGFAGFAGVIL